MRSDNFEVLRPGSVRQVFKVRDFQLRGVLDDAHGRLSGLGFVRLT